MHLSKDNTISDGEPAHQIFKQHHFHSVIHPERCQQTKSARFTRAPRTGTCISDSLPGFHTSTLSCFEVPQHGRDGAATLAGWCLLPYRRWSGRDKVYVEAKTRPWTL